MQSLQTMLDETEQRKQQNVEQAQKIAAHIQEAQRELERLNTVIIFDNGRIETLKELMQDKTENGGIKVEDLEALAIK